MAIDYSRVRDWILREDSFDSEHLGKCEAVLCLGNGYLGLRSAMEERYLNETRGLLITGTFNQFAPSAVTELVNAPDMTAVEIRIDGERFTLEQGRMDSYSRELNIRTAELIREVLWTSPKGNQVRLMFRRVVSLDRLHDFALQVEITSLSGEVSIDVQSGIDGRITNTGAQHFTEGDMRFYEGRYLQYVPKTTESEITFVLNTTHRFWLDEDETEVPVQLNMEIRRIYGGYHVNVGKGQTLRIEKYCNVFTTRDADRKKRAAEDVPDGEGGVLLQLADAAKEQAEAVRKNQEEAEGKNRVEAAAEPAEGCTKALAKRQEIVIKDMQRISLEDLKDLAAGGYEKLASDTAEEWNRQVWEQAPIRIEGNDYDNFAVQFARYHMRLAVPAHDNRMNIGAKGLSGEGYRGHCFWDTEIFLLPYYAFTHPDMARKLEEYRYLSLPGAHKKARSNGYQGAMFPWESAWLDDGEVTPEYQNADIITGRLIKVWSGFIEQHITADVAFGVWQYYVITGDQDFMDRYGYELIFDTARFWVSRLEDKNRQIHESVNEQGETVFTETVTEDGLYHICDVVGPDEYKEHKTDNAFTNYLVVWNIKKAIDCYELLEKKKTDLFKILNEKLDLEYWYWQWIHKVDKVFLPVPNACNVLPQDSTYLTLKEIDLSKYRAQDFVAGIFRDYNQTQINQIQVSKQADVLVLFLLLEDLFSHEVKAATWEYYAARTIHDSSLSLCIHAVLAADMGDRDEAYRLFEKSTEIDLGPVMTTSDAGIHIASFGGIWQGVVYGFGGLRVLGETLRIDPCLPDAWETLTYHLIWQGQKIRVRVSKDSVLVKNLTGTEMVELILCGRKVQLERELAAPLRM